MTSKTSLFNKGIYCASLRRFFWGAVLYFALLFISTSLVILLSINKDMTSYYLNNGRWALIFRQDFTMLPMLLATVVPSVTALISFRFLHSKRQAIFVHSLPVSRTANYISTVLAGLTLMAAPVVLNGVILAIISLSGYSQFFTVTSCVMWVLVNFLFLFILFAYAIFSTVITGNSFAALGLNVVVHIFLLVIAGGFSTMSEEFLYGYAGENTIFNFLSENLPVPWLYLSFLQGNLKIFLKNFSLLAMFAHLALTIIFYALALLLYKLRRMETAEDVAGFKCLNPIFKYLFTFLAALLGFTLFKDRIAENWLLVTLIVALLSGIIYFACEMMLKKTFKVWRSYKGYLGFTIVAAVVVYVFLFTSFFGYEKVVPNDNEVESVAAYEYYYRENMPWSDDADVIEYVTQIHDYFISQTHTLNDWMSNENYLDMSYITLNYKMKNGDVIKRRYPVEYERKMEIMNELYGFESYRKAVDEFLTGDFSEIHAIRVYENNATVSITDGDEALSLIECIKKDRSTLRYDEMHINFGPIWSFNLEIEYIEKKNQDMTDNDDVDLSVNYNDENRMRYTNCQINSNYKNTIQWFKDNGYWNNVKINPEHDFFLYKESNSRTKNREAQDKARRLVADTKSGRNFNSEHYAKLSEEDKLLLIEYIYSANVRDLGSEEFYEIYYLPMGMNGRVEGYRGLASIPVNEMPEFLKKYTK